MIQYIRRYAAPAGGVAAALLAIQAPAAPPAAPRPVSAATLSRLPLSFEPNTGQYGHQVRFVARGAGSTILLTGTSATLLLPGNPLDQSQPAGARPAPGPAKRGPSHRLSMRLVGSKAPASATGLQPLPGKVNYILGNDSRKWHTDIPTFQRVRFSGVYPGTDLVYYGNGRQLEYDFIVKPGADPRGVRLAFDGAESLRVAPNGSLVVGTPVGDVRMARPYAYQAIGGKRVQVACDYQVSPGSRQARFRPARYDTSRALVVDPTLNYATYVGGPNSDTFFSAAYTDSGELVAVGDSLNGSAMDILVTKLNAAGTALSYTTLLGGTDNDIAYAVKLGPDGSIYLVGKTWSNNYPTSVGAYQTAFKGTTDAVVTKLASNGSTVVYSTYLGGTGTIGQPIPMDLDSSGRVLVATGTSATDYPTTTGAYQSTRVGGTDCAISVLNATGTGLVASTYLGGSGNDVPYGVAFDADDNILVAGSAGSYNFPTTPGAYDTSNSAGYVGFVSKLNSTLTTLSCSTYLEAATYGKYTSMIGVIPNSDGTLYVAGYSNGKTYPTTAGAFKTTLAAADGTDVVITKMSGDLSALLLSTFMGGQGEDYIYGAGKTPAGDIAVCGFSTGAGLPVTADAFQKTFAGSYDILIGVMDPTLAKTVYVSYLGGSGTDVGYTVASSGRRMAFVGRATAGMPTTDNAYQKTNAGGDDGVLATFNVAQPSAITVSDVSGEIGGDVTLSATLTNSGSAVAGKTVGFTVNSVAAGNATTDANGVATLSYTIPAGAVGGTLPIGAAFAGDSDYGSGAGAGTLTVTKHSTVLAVADTSAEIGASVNLSATLTSRGVGVVGKSVSFTIDSVSAGSGTTNANGVATVSYTVPGNAVVGSKTIGASFAADTQYKSSSGTGTLSVDTIATSLVASAPAEVTISAYETVSATLTTTAGGAALQGRTVAFNLAGSSVGTATTDASGVASLTFLVPDSAAAGSATLLASFAGTAAYAESTGSASTTVVEGGAVNGYAAPASGRRGDKARLYCYLYRNVAPRDMLVGKSVTVSVDGSQVGTATTDSNGCAALLWTITNATTPGRHTITFAFAGDTHYGAWSGTGNLTVTSRVDLYAGSMPDGSPGATVTLYAYLYDKVTGDAYANQTLAFLVDGVSVGSGVTDGIGRATIQYTVPEAMTTGNHVITVQFAGNAGYPAATGVGKLVVSQKAVTTFYVRSYPMAVPGQKLKLYCYLYKKVGRIMLAGKEVTITVDGVDMATPTTDANGYAQYVYTVPQFSQTHTISVSFNGDSGNKPAYGTGVVVVP